MPKFRHSPMAYSISRMATAREIQSTADCFENKRNRSSALTGIQAKISETIKKIEYLYSLPNPNMKQIEKLIEIRKNLEQTLARSR